MNFTHGWHRLGPWSEHVRVWDGGAPYYVQMCVMRLYSGRWLAVVGQLGQRKHERVKASCAKAKRWCERMAFSGPEGAAVRVSMEAPRFEWGPT